jgi:hypothetical protein
MSNLEFVKKLYNGKNCYSDHMSAEELGLLYLKSKVEDIVSDMLDKNRIIFLTGNPGDGKTFIIKALQEKVIALNVYVQSDLNKETKYESMASDIISCYNENRPAIIAANEYPFLRLCRAIKAQSAELYNEIAYVKKSVISYDTTVIKSGGDSQIFIGKFFDENNKEIANIIPKWDVVCDFKDKLEIVQSANQISIGIDDDYYIDEEFKLILSDDNDNYVSTLLIQIESLL